ncbi:MAG TPA: sigma-70 family RNA polymerase sigma factor, partial [Urbifossiella sp.]|nr:sigma-70 family RNA polymerase sigma factor [Urbifossiella sp.]
MTTLRLVAARLAAPPDPRTDAGLVADFLRHADQPAFAELVRRHGPMVLGVCRRALGPTPDADDAFQATFLVLVRRARRTAWRDALGPWLFGVAVRVARKARAARGRRLASEKRVSPMTPEPTVPPIAVDDLSDVLDRELAALPETYRRPLVLCELQGRSRSEAARELGLAEGTVSSRLARGRRMLRDRLARRGVAPATGLAIAVPSGLAEATAGRAVALLTGASGAVPVAVMSLTEGVVKTMIVDWKLSAVAVVIGLGVTGLGFWGRVGEPHAVAAEEQKAVPLPPRPGVAPVGPDQAVATIFGDVKLSKDDYVDYLIRRGGKKQLESFVSRQIIAHAFSRKGWVLRAEDVQTVLESHCRLLGMTRAEFEAKVLPQYGKTPAEWVEDIIIPQYMLARLCGETVGSPTEIELRAAFARQYGEKRHCRVIVWPKADAATARAAVEKLRASEAAFDAAARLQPTANLAATGGRVNVNPLPVVGVAENVPR